MFHRNDDAHVAGIDGGSVKTVPLASQHEGKSFDVLESGIIKRDGIGFERECRCDKATSS